MQQSKLDNIVNLQLHEINKRGRGFVLDIAASSREKLESVRQFLLAQEGLLDDGAKIDRKELLDRIAEAIDAVGQTSIEVREALKPVDDRLLTQLGGCTVVGPGGTPLFNWLDRGLCDVVDFEEVVEAI